MVSSPFAVDDSGANVGSSILTRELSPSTSLLATLAGGDPELRAMPLAGGLLDEEDEDEDTSSSSSKSASKSASKSEAGVVLRPPAPPAAPPRFPAKILFRTPGPATRITWAIIRLTIESISYRKYDLALNGFFGSLVIFGI